MRPARKGPENALFAGGEVSAREASMRPARKGPENLDQWKESVKGLKASMRPARKGPENAQFLVGRLGLDEASMRPARKGPENALACGRGRGAPMGFNEAGPQGAGKPDLEVTMPSGPGASMRPARKGPENRHRLAGKGVELGASMRPARKGPENPGERRMGRRGDRRFNEAGPQGAGKPGCRCTGPGAPSACFNEAGPQGAGKPEAF